MRSAKLIVTTILAAIGCQQKTAITTTGPQETRRIKDARTKITLNLPARWKHQADEEFSCYSDPNLPEYNFLMSNFGADSTSLYRTDSLLEMAEAFSANNFLAKDVRIDTVDKDRVMVYYRTDMPEWGWAKDDRHWMILDKKGNSLRSALFTLSVLADRSTPNDTDKLARLLSQEVSKAVLSE